jgi:hypothetical protein
VSLLKCAAAHADCGQVAAEYTWHIGARYGSGQVNLVGDPSSLERLAAVMQAPSDEPAAIELDSVEARPYDGCLETLLVRRAAGPIAAHHDGITLTIEGGLEQLAVLGRNIAWFVANESPRDRLAHLHQEHLRDYPGAYFIGPEAVPLVIGYL